MICVLCKQQQPLEAVYAGLASADGQMAFACNSHFLSRSRLIRGWAIFALEQGQTIFELNTRTCNSDQPVY